MTATTPSITQLAAPPTMQQREGWLAHTWRLTAWTLYTLRRRALSKWLAGIFLGIFALAHGFLVLSYVAASSSPRMQQSGAAAAVLGPLTFPTSLSLAGGFVGSLGVLCIVILAGAAVGGEYGAGTVRIWLSRGVGRAQMIVAQTLALALIAVVGTAAMLALGALVGVTLGPLLGGNVSGLPDGGVGQLAGYWLAVSGQAFAYGLLALFLATLTRSTPAGIGIPLGYMFLENIASSILTSVGESLKLGGSPNVGEFIVSIPSWLLGSNVSALVSRVADGLFTSGVTSGDTGGAQSPFQPAPIDLTHALVFVVGYCAAFAVGSWLVLRRRDITD